MPGGKPARYQPCLLLSWPGGVSPPGRSPCYAWGGRRLLSCRLAVQTSRGAAPARQPVAGIVESHINGPVTVTPLLPAATVPHHGELDSFPVPRHTHSQVGAGVNALQPQRAHCYVRLLETEGRAALLVALAVYLCSHYNTPCL